MQLLAAVAAGVGDHADVDLPRQPGHPQGRLGPEDRRGLAISAAQLGDQAVGVRPPRRGHRVHRCRPR